MQQLTLTEGNGVRTRVTISVDTMATQMVRFFKNVLELKVALDKIEKPATMSSLEIMRARNYMKEWLAHGNRLTVVK